MVPRPIDPGQYRDSGGPWPFTDGAADWSRRHGRTRDARRLSSFVRLVALTLIVVVGILAWRYPDDFGSAPRAEAVALAVAWVASATFVLYSSHSITYPDVLTSEMLASRLSSTSTLLRMV
jgi:hypothetical protein